MTARKRTAPKWEMQECSTHYRQVAIHVHRSYHHRWGWQWSIFAPRMGGFCRTLAAAQRAAVKAVDRALDGER